MYVIFNILYLFQLIQNNAIGSGALEHDPRYLYLSVSKVSNNSQTNMFVFYNCLVQEIIFLIYSLNSKLMFIFQIILF